LPSLKWVSAWAITQTVEQLRRVMMEGNSPLMDETAPKDILDGILKVQQQQMKRAGLLQGSGGIWDSVGNGSDDSDEDIVVRTCAGASSK
jgi:hypothetical protein